MLKDQERIAKFWVIMTVIVIASMLAGCTDPTRVIVIIARMAGSGLGFGLILVCIPLVLLLFDERPGLLALSVQLVFALFALSVVVVMVVYVAVYVGLPLLILIGGVLWLLIWSLILLLGVIWSTLVWLWSVYSELLDAIWLVCGKWYRSFVSWLNEP